LTRIGARRDDDRDRLRDPADGAGRAFTRDDDDVDRAAGQLGGELRQPVGTPLGEAGHELDGLAVDVTEVAKPFDEGLPGPIESGRGPQVSDARDLPRRLPVGGERCGEEDESEEDGGCPEPHGPLRLAASARAAAPY
jgi:hypothetical protein